ncbi:hypothetical protein K432DRAFT_38196 [Lepidopterella palustris CBS 459.81]|uniref:DUF6594 domain-containing protein n=1 Tax=Lepidopterella palustris CBS 459.81 TaxID=1314670 RepID=A0A8E2EB11_9PEZI|nr:hypothetical protein K432DRAFT_38196 [Lepidopterella palustris CBS 459.81]
MAPSRSMTGDTVIPEKECRDSRSPISPTSPTNTDISGNTMRGDAIIDIQEDDSSSRNSISTNSSVVRSAPALPDEKPTILKRISNSFKSEPEPQGVTETNTRILENCPNGFPRLAAFQSSEANFALYRSFSYLHSRVLLDLQDEITTLEKELDEIDWDDFDDDPDRLRSREIDVQKAEGAGSERTRRQVLADIRTKLVDYDELLIKAREIESFQRPSDRNYRSVRRYHHNTKPLMDAEMDSIRSKEDIVSLRNGREWASFDGSVESMLQACDKGLKWIFRTKEPPLQVSNNQNRGAIYVSRAPPPNSNSPQKYFRTPELRKKTTNKYINFYSSSRIDKLVGILITVIIFTLLILPVIAMYRLSSFNTQKTTFDAVGVLIVFTLLFSAAMSLLTKAARHELFAASAAYCAILVVFIGNFSGGQSGMGTRQGTASS